MVSVGPLYFCETSKPATTCASLATITLNLTRRGRNTDVIKSWDDFERDDVTVGINSQGDITQVMIMGGLLKNNAGSLSEVGGYWRQWLTDACFNR
ncbi:MAG: hypothetical protein CM1200mP39_27190 [Dehalococcoidia bacterium]|nr:MAG: hypothetical protein CM1200mP39_27190 [Dehalococcoidia bacterium]